MYIRLTFDGRSEPHPLPLLQCKPILKKANKVIDDLLHLRGIFLDHLKQLGKNFAVFIVGADLRVCPGVTSYTAAGADTQVCPYDG
jgi:hypothetical protein